MKLGSFLGGVAVGALVFGTALGIFGYALGSGEPSVTVLNLTQSRIHVRVDTDTGESYVLNGIDPTKSGRTQISRGDKALWITATMPAGHTRKSDEIYAVSEVAVFVVITDTLITIDYVF